MIKGNVNMIYVYAEDEKEGYTLLKNAINIYLKNSNIVIDTLHGIDKLEEHISKLNISNEDQVYYIYDDIQENSEVMKYLDLGRKVIIQRKLNDQVTLLPILCSEYSVLAAQDIEIFVRPCFLHYIFELKKYPTDGNITKKTKQNPYFKELYATVRKEDLHDAKRLYEKYNKPYTEEGVEAFITIEKLCKKLLHLIFKLDDGLGIEHKLDECWIRNCCWKNSKVCSMRVGTKTRNLTSFEKQQFLVDNTVYIKVIKLIAQEQHLLLENIPELKLDNIEISKMAKKAIQDYSQKVSQSVKKCMYNLEIDIFEQGYSKHKAMKMCINDFGFSEIDVQNAMHIIELKNRYDIE